MFVFSKICANLLCKKRDRVNDGVDLHCKHRFTFMILYVGGLKSEIVESETKAVCGDRVQNWQRIE